MFLFWHVVRGWGTAVGIVIGSRVVMVVIIGSPMEGMAATNTTKARTSGWNKCLQEWRCKDIAQRQFS
jgi:hypothetical protein